MPTAPREDFLVIGIDFGTTYSGISWALSTKPKDVALITKWNADALHNSNQAKTPTRISYTKDGEVASWGYDHDAEDDQISWFKLLLYSPANEKYEELVEMLEVQMRQLNKEPVDLVADYLKKLHDHSMDILNSTLRKDVLEKTAIKIVLTVPALWDHHAESMMYKAARKAGLASKTDTQIMLVSEPEAAASYVLSENLGFEDGDTFVICDAGGGTVDLITYQIENVEPLRLTMCTEATGNLGGAVYLDNAFHEMIKSKIGDKNYQILSLRSRNKVLADWENGIKRNFKHSEKPEKLWFIDIPGFTPTPPGLGQRDSLLPSNTVAIRSNEPQANPAYADCEPGLLKLRTPDIIALFDAVCPAIVELVQDQVNAVERTRNSSPKAIMLVGGFGSNRYLKEELEIRFPEIAVQQPMNAWSAICRGAVLKGLNDEMVTNHIPKYSYGIVMRTSYNPHIHLEQDKEWCKYECVWKAGNQMQCYLRRGTDVSTGTPICHSFYRVVTNEDQLKEIEIEILYYDQLLPPARRTDHVKPLCTLISRVDPKVFYDLPVTINKMGRAYRHISFTVQMKFSGGSLDWSFEFEGVTKGKTSFAIDYHPST